MNALRKNLENLQRRPQRSASKPDAHSSGQVIASESWADLN